MGEAPLGITIFSSIISGLLGVIISNCYYFKQQEKELKISLIKDIAGYGFQLTENYRGSQKEIVKALNQIYIIFNSSKEVIDAVETYKKTKSTNDYITLVKRMYDDVGLKYKKINDGFIESPFCGRIEEL